MQPEIIAFDIPGQSPLPATHRLYGYQWGRRDNSNTVLCVHGLTRNGRDFDFLAQALAADFNVLCLDMPGRGKSDWLPDAASYNYATYVTDIAWLLQTLNLPKVHWVGTSMGGIIGMMLAGSLPGRIASLVLNDVGAMIPAQGLRRILGYVGVNTVFDTRAQAEATLRTNCAPYGIDEETHWQHLLTHSIEETAEGKFRLAYDPKIAAGFPPKDKVEDVDLWPLFKALEPIPLLVVRGAQSDILTQETALAMQAKHPNCTLYEVPNAGHAPALMNGEQTGFISQWLRRVPA